MSILAINGGNPVRVKPFPPYVTIGEEEKRAVAEVMESGVLSGFLGSWSAEFFGGPVVQRLEKLWRDYFRVKHAVSVNSATSGLYAAAGASGIGPGDEVIVSPYTMTASASAALVYGAIPVFADIDPEIFCLTAQSIRKCLSPLTKAVIVVDLFGHPAEMDDIMALARERDLIVIEDAAQAPGAMYNGRYAGALGHIGVFSLNYHKTIHCGEGGIIVTNDDELAERVQLIRNHGEAVVDEKGVHNLANMIGFNYRMTELQAAVAIEQLGKLERLLNARVEAATFLTQGLSSLPGITPPVVREGVGHGFYVYPIRYDASKTGVPRRRFVEALTAEGIPISEGYTKPLYWLDVYQKRQGFGRNGFPFTYPGYTGTVSYERGTCPVTERLYSEEMMLLDIVHANVTLTDMQDVIIAFKKVIEHIEELRVP